MFKQFFFGHQHEPVSTVEVSDGTIKEPDDPLERKIKIRIRKTVCKSCGRVLNIQPAGIIFDPKFDKETIHGMEQPEYNPQRSDTSQGR